VSGDRDAAAVDSAARRHFGILDFALWAVLALLSSGLIAMDLRDAQGFVLPQGNMVGRDFLNAWAGARLALDGQVHDIFVPQLYLQDLQRLLGHHVGLHAFSYPPTLLLFLWPLGVIGYIPALLMWILMTGAAYLTAARQYLWPERVPLWLAALLPASFANVWAGHHGFIFSAIWLAAFAAIGKRPIIAGLLIALLTLKPHMGLLIAVLLLVRREWRTIGWAAAGTVALGAASAAVFGLEPWINYFRLIAPLQTDLLTKGAGTYLRMMPTPYVSFWMASHSTMVAIAVQVLFALAALGLLIRAAIRRAGWEQLGLMAATATFITLPYAFNYDMEVVGIAAILLLYGKSGPSDVLARLSALLAVATPILVFVANGAGVPLLPFALLYFLWTQSKCYGAGAEIAAEPLKLAPAAR
jgi:hypothetical protein